jgi:hypothetical protein
MDHYFQNFNRTPVIPQSSGEEEPFEHYLENSQPDASIVIIRNASFSSLYKLMNTSHHTISYDKPALLNDVYRNKKKKVVTVWN